MVCRSTPVNSATTSLARLLTGVHDVEVLSMFHELRREAQHANGAMPAPSAVNYQAWLAGATERARFSTTLSPARREAIINRFNAASDQARVTGVRPDGPTFHALQEIEVRSSRAAQELDAHFDQMAARHHTTRAVVRARFDQLVTDNQAAGRQGPSAPEHLPFDRSSIPQDRSTLYALSVLHEIGPSGAGRPEGIRQAETRAAYTSRQIGDGSATRCPDCGQYQGSTHVCVHVEPVEPTSRWGALTDDLAPAERARRYFGPNATTPARDEDDLERDDAVADVMAEPFDAAAYVAEVASLAEAEAAASTIPEYIPELMETYEFCTNHGGPWGRDQTCSVCTNLDGTARDFTARANQLTGRLHRVENHPDTPAPPRVPVPAADPPTRQRTATRTYDRPGSSVRMTNLSQLRTELREQTGAATEQQVHVTLRIPNGDGSSQVFLVTGPVLATDTGQRASRTRDRYTVTTPALDLETGTSQNLRCTCPAYRRNYNCEHLRQAASQVAGRLNGHDVATIPASTIDGVRAGLTADYESSVSASARARAGWVPESEYGTDMTNFQEAWDEARERTDAGNGRVPFQTTGNITGGLGSREGGRSFGIEIEIDFPDDTTYEAKNRVAQEIFDAGLSQAPVVRGWHWSGRNSDNRGRPMAGGYSDAPNHWAVEFDRSVDDVGGARGCEIVSPILYDEPHTWANLQRICEIVESNGGRATPRTGLHINVGASDFNHTVGNHNRLLQLSEAYEDVLIRLSHNPESGPNHRGRAFCATNVVPAEGYTRIRDAQLSNSHRSMINLDHVPSEGSPITNSTRVEIRVFDGTTDAGRIQASVKVGLGLVAAAVRGETIPGESEHAGTHLAANPRRARRTGEAWREDTASFRRFADQIFSRDQDKKQLVSMFAASRWQRR